MEPSPSYAPNYLALDRDTRKNEVYEIQFPPISIPTQNPVKKRQQWENYFRRPESYIVNQLHKKTPTVKTCLDWPGHWELKKWTQLEVKDVLRNRLERFLAHDFWKTRQATCSGTVSKEESDWIFRDVIKDMRFIVTWKVEPVTDKSGHDDDQDMVVRLVMVGTARKNADYASLHRRNQRDPL